MLKGRKIFVIDGPFGQPPHTRRTGSTAPFWGEVFINRRQGLTPLAESCSPFGTKTSLTPVSKSDGYSTPRGRIRGQLAAP